jgi:uncharacterized membrane protein
VDRDAGRRQPVDRCVCAGPTMGVGILRQRYARAEINKEEFDAKKRDLS